MSNLHRYSRGGESRGEEFIDLEFGAASQKRPNDFLKKYEAKPVCFSQHHLNHHRPHQSVLNQSKSQDVITIKNKPFHSSSSMSTHSLSSSTLSSSSSASSHSLAKSASSQALVHSSPITTTIAQAIEETEAALGLNKQQIPFNYLHSKLNASRSEVKRGNLNVDIGLTNICTTLEAKNDESSLRAQINPNENLVTNNYNMMINNKQYLISYPANNETISPSSTSNATTCSSISLSSFSLASKTRLMPLTTPLRPNNNNNNNDDGENINTSGPESLNFFNFNSYISKKAVKASPYFYNLNNEMTNLSTSQQQYDNNSSLLCNFATFNNNNNKNSNNGQTSNVVNKKLETYSSQAFFFNKV